ncbi:MAG: (2Fe-2S)-binding protein, partial [Loktanella sp.]|nr:(2Fe-2S)-binding protein [Loktanella sp.]
DIWALMAEGRTLAALFVAPEPVQLARGHVAGLVGQAGAALLAGRPGAGMTDAGPTVCACFNIGLHTITAAVAAQNLSSVVQIGAALHAGTNCGSCRPELAALLPKRLEAAE